MIPVSEVQIPSNMFVALNLCFLHIQSTLVISKSKEPSEILRDIRTSTYQMCRTEENTNRTTLQHGSSIRTIRANVGFHLIEIIEYIYSKVALFGTTQADYHVLANGHKKVLTVICFHTILWWIP